MKYRLRAKVEGSLFLREEISAIEAQRDGVEFRLESDEHGRVVALSVCARIPKEIAAEFKATMTHTPDAESKAHLHFDVDREFHKNLVRQLQEMESILAFNWKGHPLKRVHWHEAKMSIVPESPEDEDLVHFWDISVSRRVHGTSVVVDPRSFKTLVEHSPRFQELTVPMAFWREGMNYLDRGEFVQAFYSHYFVIEDFFADGKTGEPGVLRAFSESDEFNKICDTTLPMFFGSGGAHEKELKILFVSEDCLADVSGLQKFLFRMRGNTHHYFGKSSRPHATPFNQEQFRCVALLGMSISTASIMGRVVTINRRYW